MTLLADILLERLHQPSMAATHFNDQDWSKFHRILDVLETCPKFRVMPQVYDISIQLYDELAAQPQLQLPHCQEPGTKWVEWNCMELKVGLLFENNVGCMFSFDPVNKRWGSHPFVWKDGQFGFTVPFKTLKGASEYLNKQIISPDDLDIDQMKLQTMRSVATILEITQIMLSMMDSPRLVEERPIIHDAPLQRARAKRGRRPLSDHSEVVIHVTRKEREARAAAEEHEKRTGRKLHFVRMFHRVKRGKVERVREHWRGTEALGTKPKPTNYRVVL